MCGISSPPPAALPCVPRPARAREGGPAEASRHQVWRALLPRSTPALLPLPGGQGDSEPLPGLCLHGVSVPGWHGRAYRVQLSLPCPELLWGHERDTLRPGGGLSLPARPFPLPQEEPHQRRPIYNVSRLLPSCPSSSSPPSPSHTSSPGHGHTAAWGQGAPCFPGCLTLSHTAAPRLLPAHCRHRLLQGPWPPWKVTHPLPSVMELSAYVGPWDVAATQARTSVSPVPNTGPGTERPHPAGAHGGPGTASDEQSRGPCSVGVTVCEGKGAINRK